MFTPIPLKNVFSSSDVNKLKSLATSENCRRVWYDQITKRQLVKHDELEGYFSKKLEPLAIDIFGDKSLKTSFSVYAKYDSEASWLPEHVDKDACVYTINYCLSANTVWPFVVDGINYSIGTNEALAFMGMESYHGRGPIPDPGNNEVEMVFFHFVPEDHWYFNHCKDFYPEIVANAY
jgi:hypothetical protein